MQKGVRPERGAVCGARKEPFSSSLPGAFAQGWARSSSSPQLQHLLTAEHRRGRRARGGAGRLGRGLRMEGEGRERGCMWAGLPAARPAAVCPRGPHRRNFPFCSGASLARLRAGRGAQLRPATRRLLVFLSCPLCQWGTWEALAEEAGKGQVLFLSAWMQSCGTFGTGFLTSYLYYSFCPSLPSSRPWTKQLRF